MSLSHHPHVHVHVSVSPRLALLFYFTRFLPHSFPFLLRLKFVDYLNLLRAPYKEDMDSSDEFLLAAGYEPNAYDFKETSVEPYTELLDSPPLFSDKVSSADPDYDDAALEDTLHQAHRAHACHSLREDLSVSLSSMSDRTVRPVKQRNQEAQMKTLLDKQEEQILAECQARINQHEFQAARAEEVQQRDQQLLQGQLLQQNLDLREAQQRSLTEMEELRKFQSSTFDTVARRKLVEDQNTKLKLSGRVQELQNEINCLSDSKEFQDAESIRSGNSHVTSQPVSFPPHPVPEGMLSRSFGVPSRREGPPSIWDTHSISGNVFVNPHASSSAPYLQELHQWVHPSRSRSIHPQWKRVKDKNKMPVRTVSQKFSHLQWRRLFKELWSRPTTTADFGSDLHFDNSLHQQHLLVGR